MKRALLAVLLSLLVGCDYSALAIPGDGPTRYRDELYGVNVTSDLRYGDGPRTFDLYTPKSDTHSRPVVIFVHGGSFAGGDKTMSDVADEARSFAARGYVTLSINYRVNSEVCQFWSMTPSCWWAVAEAMADTQDAVRYMRNHAYIYDIDPGRIAVAGSSAGAVTALNVGANPDNPSDAVQAAVSLSGVRMIGSADPGDSPAMLFHNNPDGYVPYVWAVMTVDSMNQAGLTVDIDTWNDPNHVPYFQHRDEILSRTADFLYWMLKLGAK